MMAMLTNSASRYGRRRFAFSTYWQMPRCIPTSTPRPSLSFSPKPTIRTPHSQRVRCSITTATEAKLSADELAVVEATARVTYHVANRSLSKVSVFELLAFCNVKGLSMPANIWDRSGLEAAVWDYNRKERVARLRKGAEWEAMSDDERIRLLHKVCNGEGDVTYVDPETGYTVFTFFAHLKRGGCCGVKPREEIGEDGKLYERTHRCRHCPYTDAGELKSANMSALKDRVRVIEVARERAQELWMTSGEINKSTPFETLNEKNGMIADESERIREPQSNQPQQIVNDGTSIPKLGKFVQIKKPDKEDVQCADCGDMKAITCTRCNGYTFLCSPQLMKCPQCQAKGFHPCMSCTPFRPPSKSSFYS